MGKQTKHANKTRGNVHRASFSGGIKCKAGDKSINPFDKLKVRSKHEIAGRKTKGVQKALGQSRSRAIKKRQESLLVEFQQLGKANDFVDKRFGEDDSSLPEADKLLRRFQQERSRGKQSKVNYNLSDDEELTHMGMHLSAVDDFHEQIAPDAGSDTDLDSEAVDNHFGGGMLGVDRKKSPSQPPEKHKGHNEIMAEIIAKSKMYKAERQASRALQDESVNNLDANFSDLYRMVEFKDRGEDLGVESLVDDYDQNVHQLKFENKARATDRTKTPEELIKEEADKLNRLEQDRLRRMQGLDHDDEKPSKRARRTDDDLCSSSRLTRNSDDQAVIQYSIDNDDDDHNVSDDGSVRNIDDDDLNVGDNSDDNSVDDGDDGSIDDDDDDDSDDDSEEEDEIDSEDNEIDSLKLKLEQVSEVSLDSAVPLSSYHLNKSRELALQEKEQLMEEKQNRIQAAKEEIPYAFEAPSSFEEFCSLIEGRNETDVALIIQRIIVCNHISLKETNRSKLQRLLHILFDYLRVLCVDCLLETQKKTVAVVASYFHRLDVLVPHLFELSQLLPGLAGKLCRQRLLLVKKDIANKMKMNAGSTSLSCMPDVHALVLFRLIARIFPVSDMRHSVVTPYILLMSKCLVETPVRSFYDIFFGLYICQMLLHYIHDSKRYIPEVICYLTELLSVGLNSRADILPKVFSSFRGFWRNIFVQESLSESEIPPLDLRWIFVTPDSFPSCSAQSSLLYCTVQLLSQYSNIYVTNPSYVEIFAPIFTLIGELVKCSKTANIFHHICLDILHEFNRRRDLAVKTRRPLTLRLFRPIPLRSIEPKIHENFFPGKDLDPDQERAETRKLKRKVKEARKGASRELRKDTLFLAQEKRKQEAIKATAKAAKQSEIRRFIQEQGKDTNPLAANSKKKRKRR